MQPVDRVNPLMGTDSNYEVSNGNVYPAIARPWGMKFWMPRTGKMGDRWSYTYSATKIKGFNQRKSLENQKKSKTYTKSEASTINTYTIAQHLHS